MLKVEGGDSDLAKAKLGFMIAVLLSVAGCSLLASVAKLEGRSPSFLDSIDTP